jgi:hypothetical protein
MNLFDETIRVLKKDNYTFDDILSVQGNKYRISVEKFIEIAKKTDYDDGYGSQEVASDLVLLMKDGSFYYRFEYDGAECWKHSVVPKVIEHIDDDLINCLHGKHWPDMAECNGLSTYDADEEGETEEEPMKYNNSLTNGAWDELDKLDLK